jgi:hypothetical protein
MCNHRELMDHARRVLCTAMCNHRELMDHARRVLCTVMCNHRELMDHARRVLCPICTVMCNHRELMVYLYLLSAWPTIPRMDTGTRARRPLPFHPKTKRPNQKTTKRPTQTTRHRPLGGRNGPKHSHKQCPLAWRPFQMKFPSACTSGSLARPTRLHRPEMGAGSVIDWWWIPFGCWVVVIPRRNHRVARFMHRPRRHSHWPPVTAIAATITVTIMAMVVLRRFRVERSSLQWNSLVLKSLRVILDQRFGWRIVTSFQSCDLRFPSIPMLVGVACCDVDSPC